MSVRHFALFLVCTLLATDAAAAEPIAFPFENKSDLRGVLNAFHAFKRACLDQPVTPDLPERLLPEGYRIVGFAAHLWGTEETDDRGTRILSATGSEEADFAGGHPIVEFRMPKDGAPDGRCRVVWHRAWDYPAEQRGDIMFSTVATLTARISHHFQAFLLSRPDDLWPRSNAYALVSDWRTRCWNDTSCDFTVLASLSDERGIELTITRRSASQ